MLALALPACAPVELSRTRDASRPDAGAPEDAGRDAVAIDAIAPRDAVAVDVADRGVDGATLVSALFPRNLGCTAHAVGFVTMSNTGTSTWSAAAGYALAAVDGSDPFASTLRVALDVSVLPGESIDLRVPLDAGGAVVTATTDWRMVHDGDGPFGDVASQEIAVGCDTPSAADFHLADVTIVSSPDVRGFDVTSRITSLSFSPGTIHIDHELRGTWPPVVIADDGTEQEATIWVFFHIGGQWYATGGERLRPNQTDKALPNPSFIGSEWLYEPGRWGVMTGYAPAPGDLVGFMVVAGSTRSDDHVIARERTRVVLVPFPADDVTTTYPPFAWEE